LVALTALIAILAGLFSNIDQQAVGGATPSGESIGRGWFWSGDPQASGYDVGFDHAVAYTGQSSGYIQSTIPKPAGFATLMQIFRADEYRGKLLRLSAYVKADRVDGWAGLWMRVDGPGDITLAFDNMQSRSIQGTSDWTRYETVLDVPEDSVNIAFGILMQGNGVVWLDDVQFDVVGRSMATAVPVTPTPEPVSTTPIPRAAMERPLNLDFETGLKGWWSDDASQDYEIGIDPMTAHAGQASGFVQSITPEPKGNGVLAQTLKADEYRGRRVRLSVYAKSAGVEGWADFWVHVLGPEDRTLRSDSRLALGTTDWKRLEIVLDVAEDGVTLEYGISLEGKGRVWIDDAHIEVVGLDVPTTGFGNYVRGPTRPRDLDFEAGVAVGQSSSSWMAGSTNPGDYGIDIDTTAAYTGNASGHIKSKASANGLGFASLSQYIIEYSYLGKRVRLSGYVKTDRAIGSASLWMRVDGRTQMASIDNMRDRSIHGTTDWQRYDVVLDVPRDGIGIAFGALLQGTGEMWFDDLRLEVVGTDVPTTGSPSVMQRQPLDLGFEE
jgi:hypothetical protein